MYEELARAIGVAVLTQGLGAVGAGLGVWNLVRSIQADRVHLLVAPVLRWRVPGGLLTVATAGLTRQRMDALGPPFLCVSVVNRSKFKVTVYDVGLCERSPSSGPRRGFVDPELGLGDALPAVLGPRGKAIIVAPLTVWEVASVTSRTRVYASTACDHDKAKHSALLATWFADVRGWLREARERAGRDQRPG
jgi:hypothetical protein